MRAQLEEDLGDDLKWSMRVKEVMFSGKSEYQEVDLIHTGPFGRVSAWTSYWPVLLGDGIVK